MTKLLLAFLLSSSTLAARYQNNDTTKNQVFNIVERMPDFPGGINVFMQYIASNIRYPQEALKKNIQGRVIVTFIVEKNGTVSNVKVLRSVSPELDAEATRVVKSSPKWKPGENNGQLVRCPYTIPILFSSHIPVQQDTSKKE